ncbi:MAG: hypothetical protein JSS96_17575, partial [Bacteroidetes bacterium]|nr:hypothetical protein [Bacteroidota bacterium]
MIRLLFAFFLVNSINVFSQTPQPIKTSGNGCMIWSDEYSSNDSIIWNGACKNGYASGVGILKWYRDNKLVVIYKGAMKYGRFNGYGKYEIIGYATFEGHFISGALNGKGAAYFSNGG